MQTRVRPLPSFTVWFAKSLAGAAVGVAMVYIALSLASGMSLFQLARPMEIDYALAVLFGISVFWCRRRMGRAGHGLRYMATAAGVFSWLVLVVFAYYASKFKIVAPEAARGYCIVSLVLLPPAFVAAYYIVRKIVL